MNRDASNLRFPPVEAPFQIFLDLHQDKIYLVIWNIDNSSIFYTEREHLRLVRRMFWLEISIVSPELRDWARSEAAVLVLDHGIWLNARPLSVIATHTMKDFPSPEQHFTHTPRP